MAIAQQIGEAIEEVSEVKRWIDNDVEAGDTMIQEHADRLASASEKLEQAKAALEQLDAQQQA